MSRKFLVRMGVVLVAMCLSLWCALVPSTAAVEGSGGWREICKGGGSVGSALVWCPVRKEVLSWGGLQSGNEVRAFDAERGKWIADYRSDEWNAHTMGGSFYGGQGWAAWLKTGRPGPFMLFRQACWDAKRARLVIAAENLTAAYDPVRKTWVDLQAAFETRDGKRIPGCAPAGYRAPWFAPVPGQWGSMCYDPVNDEILLFPLWATRARVGPERPVDAGVRAGHYGTLIFDCKTNTWKRPVFGGEKILAAREWLARLINEQREACRAGWKALIALRQEKREEAARLMVAAAGIQKRLVGKLAAERAALENLVGELKGYEAAQVRDAVENITPVVARAEDVSKGLAAGRPEALPALCAKQRTVYRRLRLIRRDDLYVQPLPRCATSVVYDAKNKVIVMAGGNHLDRLLNDTWVYDCRTRRWQRKSPAPEAANWPGMCFDSKRGLVIYAAAKGTYGYDAGRDRWYRMGPGRPRGVYCDMAYDASRDAYVLMVASSKYAADGRTFVMKPGERGVPVVTRPAAPEKIDEAPFPPPADPAVLARLKSLPANIWVLARPPKETIGRSWSTMVWDPALRAVIYQGGGHGGTLENQVSAYFPEANRWVDSFPPQRPPALFGNWSDAGAFPAFERGMGLAMHCRWYVFYGGRCIRRSMYGFEWATRERPFGVKTKGPFDSTRFKPCLYAEKGWVIEIPSGRYAAQPIRASTVLVTDLDGRRIAQYKPAGPVPQVTCEWSGMTVHPDKNLLVLHGAGDARKKKDTETWVLDLAAPTAWRKLDIKGEAPRCGMAALIAIPGTDLCVLASPYYRDLWVLSLERKAWRRLGTTYGDGLDRGIPGAYGREARGFFSLYGQCVYDPYHKIFIRKGDYGHPTLLLRPDFSAIRWEEKKSLPVVSSALPPAAWKEVGFDGGE